ncbi:MAG: pyruvate dehydrogenase complex dihydrolipoamide acetyltransferase [Bacteroidota bacterium]
MAEVIRMPRMSDTMEEGVIVEWLKAEGDEIEAGETLAEVETDKATMELDSFVDGVLLHIAVKEGAVPIDGIIAVIGEAGEDWQAAIAAATGADSEATTDSTATDTDAATTASTETAAEPVAATAVATNGDSRVKASPLARSIAKDEGIDLAAITGSGDQGRIVKRDVEAYLASGTQTTAPAAPPTPAPVAEVATTVATTAPTAPKATPAPQPQAATPSITPFVYGGSTGESEEIPVTQMRKTIARRLSESKYTAPHFYLTVEVDMGNAVQLRKKLNTVAPTKLSFNDLVIKAAAAALRLHPAINSSWLGDKIRRNKEVNIGVAVAVDEGLLVPVIRYADIKTMSQINVEVKEMAGRARQKKLKPEEMSGNTFTISNLGMFGIEEFTAIINPPDACILAVGAIVEKPVVKDGAIAVGHRMKMTLSCDHRVVDGATGAQFVKTLKEILENPIRLLV